MGQVPKALLITITMPYEILFKLSRRTYHGQGCGMKILDVGCGDRPTGNVNLDLFFYGKWKNFIIGEAQHLPFKNEVFDKVYSKNCLEHLENPLEFFNEANRVLREGGILECIYPTDTMLRKKTIHNLLNLHWSSAFKWKTKLTGGEKITYFPSIRMDTDRKKRRWKIFLNKRLPKWQIETKFEAEN